MTLSKLLTPALAASAMLLGSAASAATIQITITNTTGAGGFSVTPLYTAFHDGTFDAFNIGEEASAGLELIAETGMASGIAGERLLVDPDSQGNVNPSPSGPPPIQPGEQVTAVLDIDGANNQYLTFLAMLLPTNDTFIGNDDARAHRIFDDSGAFLGPQTIEVTGSQIFDAGTEINALAGSAFVAGQDITLGGTENGTVQRAGADITEIFAGVELAAGGFLGSGDVLDFFRAPGDFNLLSIEITEVSAVPLPATAPMLLAGFGLLGWRMRKSKKA